MEVEKSEYNTAEKIDSEKVTSTKAKNAGEEGTPRIRKKMWVLRWASKLTETVTKSSNASYTARVTSLAHTLCFPL